MGDMEMGGALPGWVSFAAWAWIALSLVSAAVILVAVRRRSQRRGDRFLSVMWPLSALYLGPFGLPLYLRSERAATLQSQQRQSGAASGGLERLYGVLSGGVASGLAHVVAVPFVVATGLTIAGLDMWAMVAIIAVLATGLIVAFDYARQGRRPSFGRAVATALLTVLAFDVGMLGWMLVLHYTDTMPAASDVRFTFLMQLGLMFGSLTALPLMRVLGARRYTSAAVA